MSEAVRCESTVPGYRCELAAGHDGYHKTTDAAECEKRCTLASWNESYVCVVVGPHRFIKVLMAP